VVQPGQTPGAGGGVGDAKRLTCWNGEVEAQDRHWCWLARSHLARMEKTDLMAPRARGGCDGVVALTQSRRPARIGARSWCEAARPTGGGGRTFRDDAQRPLATVCDPRALKTACATAPARWHRAVQGTKTRLIGTNAANPQISTKTLRNAPRRGGTKPLASRGWPAAAGPVLGWLRRFRKSRTRAHATSCGGGWRGTKRVAAGAGSVSGRPRHFANRGQDPVQRRAVAIGVGPSGVAVGAGAVPGRPRQFAKRRQKPMQRRAVAAGVEPSGSCRGRAGAWAAVRRTLGMSL